VIPEKRKRRAQGKDEEREREGHREKMKKEKEKKGIQLPEKTTICPLSGIKPEKKLQAIGSMQCTNDYCTILKRIRNE
jgi:hypothetical protein